MQRLTRANAIKKDCFDCAGGTKRLVRLCASYECPLWRFRKGIEIHDELHPFIKK